MAMAKKCDRCGKLYEHYPKGNKSQSNAMQYEKFKEMLSAER